MPIFYFKPDYPVEITIIVESADHVETELRVTHRGSLVTTPIDEVLHGPAQTGVRVSLGETAKVYWYLRFLAQPSSEGSILLTLRQPGAEPKLIAQVGPGGKQLVSEFDVILFATISEEVRKRIEEASKRSEEAPETSEEVPKLEESRYEQASEDTGLDRWDPSARMRVSLDDVAETREAPAKDAEAVEPSFEEPEAPSTGARGRLSDYRVAAPEPLEKAPGELYRVWFGTNRRPAPDLWIRAPFTSERDNVVHLGFCEVHIPESHKVGSLGSSWIKRLFTGDDRVVLQEVVELPETEFWSALAESCRLVPEHERQAVVYIHGYNTTFEDAARRAAQIGCDLSIRGAMGFFSWPSKAKKKCYIPDAAAVEASESQIADFLASFARQSGSDRVHVIAHSMGNRGLLRAISRIVADASRVSSCRFTHLILAAPDVDTHVFADLARNFEKVAKRATLYISDKDVLLEASSWLHDYPRAGVRPPVTVVPNVDTVDVGRIDLSLLGHSYFGGVRDVLQDMYRLIHSDALPKKRMGLAEVEEPGGARYWTIRA